MSSTEIDALVGQYSHLASFPREKDALHALKKISSLVKPIMRARNWKVGTLAEFYPEQQNLLGLNINRGQKICLRLRYPGDKNQFLPMEQVVDTMLHELSHNVHGPHDEKFHALWDQLRREYEALISKGYTGEGFMSNGHRLGGRSVPRDEARRIARAAAERRQALSAGSGQKLGGKGIRVGQDVRRVIADAAERRIKIMKGCASNNKDYTEREVIEIADEADEAGFKTQAEEDEANDRAIAQAMWDLVQEDEKTRYGDDYIVPSARNPAGSQGVMEPPTEKDNMASSKSRQPTRPQSRLVTGSTSSTNRPRPPTTSSSSNRQSEYFIPVSPSTSKPSTNTTSQKQAIPSGWTCDICTLHNPLTYLCCDACGTERPDSVSAKISRGEQERKQSVQQKQKEVQRQEASNTWRCQYCTNVMENKWWTCSVCFQMKASS